MSSEEPAPSSRPSSRVLTTDRGVRVVLNPHLAPPPVVRRRRGSEPPPPSSVPSSPRALHDKYSFHIRKFLGRGDLQPASIDDLAQECFVALLRAIGSPDPPRHLRAFLARDARHRLLKRWERRRTAPMPTDELEEHVASEPDPESALRRAEREAQLERLLGALSPVEAEVVRLTYLEELTVEQIAAATGRSRGTVFDQLTRARAKLRAAAAELEG